MKRKKKKYNPLKKYNHGGKHDEQPDTKPNPKSAKWDNDMSQSTFNALMAGYDSGEGDDESEDLMAGRTFIPRMSESQRAEIMAGGKELMDKIRAKRKGEKKEGVPHREHDEHLDFEFDEEFDEPEEEAIPKEEKQETPEEQETTSSTRQAPAEGKGRQAPAEGGPLTGSFKEGKSREEVHGRMKYGGKILKKYSKKKKSKR